MTQPCDNIGDYQLYSSTSKQPTRLWNRAESSGRDYACSQQPCLLSQKLKYQVLLYNQDNKGPGYLDNVSSHIQIAQFEKGLSNPNYVRNVPPTSVRVGNIYYYVRPDIYAILIQQYNPLPDFSLDEIQKVIEQIKVQNNIPDVNPYLKLKDVPLSQFKKRYVYNGDDTKWQVQQDQYTGVVRNYKSPYKIIGNLNPPPFKILENFNFFGNLGLRRLRVKNAQYISVIHNSGCGYATKLDELYPNQPASYWGGNILPNLSVHNAITGLPRIFYPNLALIQPESWSVSGGNDRLKFGVIIGIDVDSLGYLEDYVPPDLLPAFLAIKALMLEEVKKYSEMIFIPIQNDVEFIQNRSYDINSGVTFPVMSGGLTNRDSLVAFGEKATKYAQTNNPNYKLLIGRVNDFFIP